MTGAGGARFAALAVTAMLAACGAPSPRIVPPQVADLSAAPQSAVAAPDPAPAADSVAVAAVSADPARLKGMIPHQLTTLFGPPTLIRRDYPAEVWQYAGKGCVLDLYLYDEGGTRTVAFYQVRKQAPVSQKQCLGDLMAGKRAG